MNFNPDFFSELQERIPKVLLNYWGMRRVYHFGENITFEAYIMDVVNTAFYEVSESRLSDHISKIRVAQRKKKRDWHKKFLQLIEYSYDDVYSPLNNDYDRIKKMSPLELINDYEDMAIEDILNIKKTALINSENEWFKRKDSFFAEFPSFSIHNDRTLQNILRDDVVMVACNYISKELKFDFKKNIKSLPTPIVNKPIFSLASSKINLEEIDGVLQSIIKENDEGDTFSVVPVHTEEKITNLTKKDREIYRHITHLANTIGRDDDGYRVVPINYYALACQVYGYAVNKKDIDFVKKSVERIANHRYLYKKGNEKIDYILIDSIYTNTDDENNALIYLGRVVSQAIRNKDLISISKKTEDKIESPYGALFIYALQGLRFLLLRDSPEIMAADITLDFFEECLNFNIRSYKKKVAIILDCLEDYLNHEIIISNYKYSNDIFHLEFLSLSTEDLQYYNDWLTSHPKNNWEVSQSSKIL